METGKTLLKMFVTKIRIAIVMKVPPIPTTVMVIPKFQLSMRDSFIRDTTNQTVSAVYKAFVVLEPDVCAGPLQRSVRD